MLGSDEVRKRGGQIQFCPGALSVAGPRLLVASEPKKSKFRIRTATAVRSVNVVGSQVLPQSVSALGSIGLFVWAFVKLWLFGH